jgi:hypothetical protein
VLWQVSTLSNQARASLESTEYSVVYNNESRTEEIPRQKDHIH